METLALLLVAVPLFAFVGYPALVIAAAAVVGRRSRVAGGFDGPVAVVICAHNEAGRIGAKLDSVRAAVDAGGVLARIIVADDGSTDDTAAEAERRAGVEVIRLPRGGKAAALNRATPRTADAILVMTDADPLFDAATLPALLAPFADPDVGAVAGRVETLRGKARLAGFDRLFRRYESAVRQAESDLFGSVSADGGLYAIRAPLMPLVPADVTDDFYISTAAVAAGYRIAYADDARAFEHSISGEKRNFRRRVRITVRGLTALWSRRALMNPGRTGWYAPALLLHKVVRRLAPLALPPLWVAAGVLTAQGRIGWAVVFAGLSALALIGLVGALAPGRLPRFVSPAVGVALHLAGLGWGALLFLFGRRYAQWTPQKDGAA
ncbi:glycosyltransferase [Sphingomonas sp.]|jgi:glycosyltransferase involved in cell wall biosynthesis|uniref:glycosyltransferase n=1 Tax=Sphingomonas sp. TaxID=28214 RepID=UPI0035C7E4D6